MGFPVRYCEKYSEIPSEIAKIPIVWLNCC
jgi:hypothetical protein